MALWRQDPVPAERRPVVTVRPSGSADFVGADQRTLSAALARLEHGGTLILGAGRYVIRRTLFLPADLVLRGEPGSTLALPTPQLTAMFAPAGSRELVLVDEGEFAGEGQIAVFPPVGQEFLPDGESPGLGPLALTRMEGARLFLREPLATDVPAGSRVSYPIKLLWVNRAGRVRFENLTFDGGQRADLPVFGHFMHCAIWASPPFGFGSERLGPPARYVVVRNCRFHDWYGRPIALYHVEDSVIEGSLFERTSDEAIDLDHYCRNVRVFGNVVRDAQWGIVLNDASCCTIEGNVLEDCGIGIHNWWFAKIPLGGINEENVIRHNVVTGSRERSIFVDRECHRNVIEFNRVDREIEVVEPSNRVEANVVF